MVAAAVSTTPKALSFVKLCCNDLGNVKPTSALEQPPASEQPPSSQSSSSKAPDNKPQAPPFDYSKWDAIVDQEIETEPTNPNDLSSLSKSMGGCAHDRSQERQIYEKPTAEKLEACQRFCELGKEYVSKEKWQEAALAYRKAQIQLDYTFPDTPEEDAIYTREKLRVHLNAALCDIKLKKWDEGLKECYQVLQLDSKNTKALYRRAQIYFARDDLDEAENELKKAAETARNNPAIIKLFSDIARKRKLYRERSKKVAKAALHSGRNGGSSTVPNKPSEEKDEAVAEIVAEAANQNAEEILNEDSQAESDQLDRVDDGLPNPNSPIFSDEETKNDEREPKNDESDNQSNDEKSDGDQKSDSQSSDNMELAMKTILNRGYLKNRIQVQEQYSKEPVSVWDQETENSRRAAGELLDKQIEELRSQIKVIQRKEEAKRRWERAEQAWAPQLTTAFGLNMVALIVSLTVLLFAGTVGYQNETEGVEEHLLTAALMATYGSLAQVVILVVTLISIFGVYSYCAVCGL